MPGAAAEAGLGPGPGPGSAAEGAGAGAAAEDAAPGRRAPAAMTAAELAGRFQLVQEVGRGSGGSAVFRALDARGGAVAVKRVPLARLSAQGRAALRREVDLLADLRGHPKVVQCVGHGEDAAGHLWLVTEVRTCGRRAGTEG